MYTLSSTLSYQCIQSTCRKFRDLTSCCEHFPTASGMAIQAVDLLVCISGSSARDVPPDSSQSKQNSCNESS